MMTLIEKGEATRSRLLGQDASVSIVYRRGEEAVELSATVGQTEYEQPGQVGDVLFTSRDYMVDRDLLIISSGRTVPQKGDRIWQRQGGTTLIHEVMTPGTGMQCYEPSGETRWRIHTKEL